MNVIARGTDSAATVNGADELTLGATVTIAGTHLQGIVVGRAEYLFAEDNYLVRYPNEMGGLAEEWWGGSALEAAAQEGSR